MALKNWAAFVTLVLLTTACSKRSNVITGTEKDSHNDTALTGTWQWLRTDGGIGFHIHDTPQSTGKKIELKLAADGTYAFFTNNTKTVEGTYTLETKTCIHDGMPKTYIQFSSGQGVMVEKLDAQQLDVSDEFYDGVGSQYKRLPAGIN